MNSSNFFFEGKGIQSEQVPKKIFERCSEFGRNHEEIQFLNCNFQFVVRDTFIDSTKDSYILNFVKLIYLEKGLNFTKFYYEQNEQFLQIPYYKVVIGQITLRLQMADINPEILQSVRRKSQSFIGKKGILQEDALSFTFQQGDYVDVRFFLKKYKSNCHLLCTDNVYLAFIQNEEIMNIKNIKHQPMDQKQNFLELYDLFSYISHISMLNLVYHSYIAVYQPNELFQNEREKTFNMYMVVSGQFRDTSLSNKKGVGGDSQGSGRQKIHQSWNIHELRQGSFLNDDDIVENRKNYSYSLRCTSPEGGELFVMPANMIGELIKRYHSFRAIILQDYLYKQHIIQKRLELIKLFTNKYSNYFIPTNKDCQNKKLNRQLNLNSLILAGYNDDQYEVVNPKNFQNYIKSTGGFQYNHTAAKQTQEQFSIDSLKQIEENLPNPEIEREDSIQKFFTKNSIVNLNNTSPAPGLSNGGGGGGGVSVGNLNSRSESFLKFQASFNNFDTVEQERLNKTKGMDQIRDLFSIQNQKFDFSNSIYTQEEEISRFNQSKKEELPSLTINSPMYSSKNKGSLQSMFSDSTLSSPNNNILTKTKAQFPVMKYKIGNGYAPNLNYQHYLMDDITFENTIAAQASSTNLPLIGSQSVSRNGSILLTKQLDANTQEMVVKTKILTKDEMDNDIQKDIQKDQIIEQINKLVFPKQNLIKKGKKHSFSGNSIKIDANQVSKESKHCCQSQKLNMISPLKTLQIKGRKQKITDAQNS